MLFSNLDTSIKRQIRASMKRISLNLIKLNRSTLGKLTSDLVFQAWINRYIRLEGDRRYYDLMLVDSLLFAELEAIMKTIFERELTAAKQLNSSNEHSISKSGKNIKEPATSKQINYANYLMNMVNNKNLPEKTYSKDELSHIISSLRNRIKAV